MKSRIAIITVAALMGFQAYARITDTVDTGTASTWDVLTVKVKTTIEGWLGYFRKDETNTQVAETPAKGGTAVGTGTTDQSSGKQSSVPLGA